VHAQTYTFLPQVPLSDEQIQILVTWPDSGNFVQTIALSIACRNRFFL